MYSLPLCTKGCPNHHGGGDGDPSLSPAEADDEGPFADAVAASCVTVPPTVPGGGSFCEWLNGLDELVQTGAVRMRFAAMEASTPRRVSYLPGAEVTPFFVTFLSNVLDAQHAPDGSCGCLAKVLAWGTCPHVSWILGRTPASSSFLMYTPLARAKTEPWKRMLLEHGCPPWRMFDVKPCGQCRPFGPVAL